MTLFYTPQLIDYRLKSFVRDGVHYVRGHLLGTKIGDKGWGVSKDTIKDNIKQFKGMPFIVSPKQLDPSEHFLVGSTYDEQLEKQKIVTRGNIIDILGPFDYNDNTEDFYYDFEAHIDDKEISDALVTGRLPFATSPYIWPTDENGTPIDPSELTKEQRAAVKHWKPVHEALVTQGTFGDIAKIHKQCVGPQGVCKQALAGSSEKVAEILSSQIDIAKQQTSNTMSDQPNVQSDSKPETQVEQVPSTIKITSQAPIQAPVVEEKKEVNEEFETLKKELEAEKVKTEKLTKIHKTSVLSGIFTNFEDEDTKKGIIKKYIDQDVDILSDFAKDVLAYGIPKKEKKEKENPLTGNSEKETFPLTGNSKDMNSLNQDLSLTTLFGGTVQ